MKDVEINIKSSQSWDDNEDGMELMAYGSYSFNNGKAQLTYMESELTGMSGTKTTFTVDGEIINLRREGTVNSIMMFQEGKKHYFAYDTPYGSLMMGVNTGYIGNNLSEYGGSLVIKYTIDMESSLVSRNCFKIDVRESR